MALDPSFLQTDADSDVIDELPATSGAPVNDGSSPEVAYLREAGVQILLDHPFRLGDRLIREIALPPVPLGVSMDVLDGVHETLLDVLVAVTGEPIELFRALRGGDEDAVIGAFIRRLPDSIRALVEQVR